MVIFIVFGLIYGIFLILFFVLVLIIYLEFVKWRIVDFGVY